MFKYSQPSKAWRRERLLPSLPESFRSISVPLSSDFFRKLGAFAGPGYLVAVGYMDPGNWATDIAGGSRFGFSLLAVVLLSSLMAILLQSLAVKLGVVTERDLAQACRDHYSKPTALILWVLCELAIVACDLAEIIGAAIALNLLFSIPLLWGIAITVLDVFLILLLQGRGFRFLEAIVIAMVATIGVCFGIQVFLASPEWSGILRGFLPRSEIVTNPEMLYLAIGILGATVMPHNLYLHSSIVQTRNYDRSPGGKREAIKYATIDGCIALFFAMCVNSAILIVAAATFFVRGHTGVAEIHQAYQLLSPLLGAAGASTLFALALLASGQSSTLTGTLAGQVVMEGFLDIRLSPWLRRLITRALAVVPALVVTALYGEHGTAQLLVFSQVVLSMQLSFAVFPLVLFTSDPGKMGEFVNRPLTRWVAWGTAVFIALLNGWLLYQTFAG